MPTAASLAAIEFGRRVRIERQDLGATQRQVAEEAEIDESTYRKIETGQRNPSLHNMIRIASALRVDLGDLTRGLDVSAVPVQRERTSPRVPLDELKQQRAARQR